MMNSKIALMFLLLAAMTSVTIAQTASEPKFRHELGLLWNRSMHFGDGPDLVQSQVNGLNADPRFKYNYNRDWSSSMGLYYIQGYSITRHLGFELGGKLQSLRSSEQLLYFDGATLGSGNLPYRSTTIRNTYLNLSPSLAMVGSVQRFSLSLGLTANVFLYGRTKVDIASTMEGSPTESTQQVRLDTKTASQIGDNWTASNHGAAPIWLSSQARLSWKVLPAAWAPVLGVAYQLPLTEIQPSKAANWAFEGSFAPVPDYLDYGTAMRTVTLSIGWQF